MKLRQEDELRRLRSKAKWYRSGAPVINGVELTADQMFVAKEARSMWRASKRAHEKLLKLEGGRR